MSLPNYDSATGIHYGAISVHSVHPDMLDLITDRGDNLTLDSAVDEAQQNICNALEPVLDDLGVLPWMSKFTPRPEDRDKRKAALTEIAKAVWNEIEQDYHDQYEPDVETFVYEDDGYKIEYTRGSALAILMVLKSPYYTYARPCSPCVPNAGDIDHAVERGHGNPTYCLGPEWFTDEDGNEKAPYALFSSADGVHVNG